MKTNISREFLGLHFTTPLLVSSGKWAWNDEDVRSLREQGACGIILKSHWSHFHQGHPEPFAYQDADHWINAVGLPSEGILRESQKLGSSWLDPGIIRIPSIVGDSPSDYAAAAQMALEHLSPHALELNFSCPNVAEEFGDLFSDPEKWAHELVAAVRPVTDLPLIAKLSPTTQDILPAVKACVETGIDAVNIGNTLGPGLRLDPKTAQPRITNHFGGISGPGLLPLTLKHIATARSAFPDLGLIATGGVTRGSDIVECLMAGADLVGTATVLLQEGFPGFARLQSELLEHMEDMNWSDLSQIPLYRAK